MYIQEPGNPASEVDDRATSTLVETGPRPLGVVIQAELPVPLR